MYERAYSGEVEIEWDPAKAAANLRKHEIDFADAALALEDDLALTVEDLDAESENRFVAIGTDPIGRLLVVVFTWRGERIRLISARRATPRERRQYEERR